MAIRGIHHRTRARRRKPHNAGSHDPAMHVGEELLNVVVGCGPPVFKSLRQGSVKACRHRATKPLVRPEPSPTQGGSSTNIVIAVAASIAAASRSEPNSSSRPSETTAATVDACSLEPRRPQLRYGSVRCCPSHVHGHCTRARQTCKPEHAPGEDCAMGNALHATLPLSLSMPMGVMAARLRRWPLQRSARGKR